MVEPLVCIAILAHNKEHALPIYLKCLEAFDYPKERIALYIRTNNNNDHTTEILENWLIANKDKYHSSHYDPNDIEGAPRDHGRMEWTTERFKILGNIRQESVNYAASINADYYFVVDCDNFLAPSTLRALVNLQLEVVAPFLRVGKSTKYYSNYHAGVNEEGYYKDMPLYYWIFNREAVGLIQVPVVHCTYLIRRDIFTKIRYLDNTDRYEYAIFSDILRQQNVPQYMDNRKTYGVLTFHDNEPMNIEEWLDELKRHSGESTF
jgi:glycosyltransferase involved in cell wall biosynthesis